MVLGEVSGSWIRSMSVDMDLTLRFLKSNGLKSNLRKGTVASAARPITAPPIIISRRWTRKKKITWRKRGKADGLFFAGRIEEKGQRGQQRDGQRESDDHAHAGDHPTSPTPT